MLVDVKKRFQFVLSTSVENFDPVFVAATFLNPPYRKLLNSAQEKEAKMFILQLMRGDDLEQNHDSLHLTMNCLYTLNNEGTEVTEHHEEEPPKKRFKHLDRVSNLLETDEYAQESQAQLQTCKEEEELNKFLQEKFTRKILAKTHLSIGLPNMTAIPYCHP
jgi:hypothetical protein